MVSFKKEAERGSVLGSVKLKISLEEAGGEHYTASLGRNKVSHGKSHTPMANVIYHGKSHGVWVLPYNGLSHGSMVKTMDIMKGDIHGFCHGQLFHGFCHGKS